MINTTTHRPHRRHFIGDLMVIEMPNVPYGRAWAIQPEDDYVIIEANLGERERRYALRAALAALAIAQESPLISA